MHCSFVRSFISFVGWFVRFVCQSVRQSVSSKLALLACLLFCLLVCFLACLRVYVRACLLACLFDCLFACLLACLLVWSLACLCACLLACWYDIISLYPAQTPVYVLVMTCKNNFTDHRSSVTLNELFIKHCRPWQINMSLFKAERDIQPAWQSLRSTVIAVCDVDCYPRKLTWGILCCNFVPALRTSI